MNILFMADDLELLVNGRWETNQRKETTMTEVQKIIASEIVKQRETATRKKNLGMKCEVHIYADEILSEVLKCVSEIKTMGAV